jgi:hypothetical protein
MVLEAIQLDDYDVSIIRSLLKVGRKSFRDFHFLLVTVFVWILIKLTFALC